ncbi:glycosyltransferase family 4 protein [Halomarina salina]|uniref:Glycosyltransferase family 4 protein n=1 Tax=Halomarina salina TaxID=1872699 RepID=A0ABD5RTH8_9EURY|nr:glycosyltransferase family 4 protein [Halomarina salina]
MHILHVTHRYPPSDGGVERHVRALATRQRRAGHRVTVVAADGGDLPVFEVREGVAVRRLRGVAPGDAYYFAPGLSSALQGGPADLVHVHNYHAFPFVQAALATDVPVVATPHYHGTSADRLRRLLLAAYRPLGRRALARAAAVVAVSDWERERLAADFGVDATLVRNGVDQRFAAARGAGHDRDRPYLLCVGRLVEYKGVGHAIRALASLPEYDLLVAGSGPERAAFERLARRAGVADRVTFLGYVPDDDLPAFYAGASAHLALSSVEAYGLTVGESLAAGTPAVVSATRGLRDWAAREDCVGVADRSPHTVATAVHRAVGRAAPSAAIPTWDDCADGVAAVYDRVVDGSDAVDEF